MELTRRITLLGSDRKTIARSKLAVLSACNSKKLPLAVNDYGVRREWVGIGWIDVGKARGDEVVVVDDLTELHGRFAIVLPRSKEAIFRTKRRLWETREEAELRLTSALKRALFLRELHSAYVGEIGKDFWPSE